MGLVTVYTRHIYRTGVTRRNVSLFSMVFPDVTVGFGTAALGGNSYNVVNMALSAGFRRFDTAEADWWYDQKEVGRALSDFFTNQVFTQPECSQDPNNEDEICGTTCAMENLHVSTKIGPWDLTSEENVRAHAKASREELVGFCTNDVTEWTSHVDGSIVKVPQYPLDVYYIHAPACWKGWHSRCENHPPLMELRSSWLAMEAVVGLDYSARKIGLSNIRPDELLDIIKFVDERKRKYRPESGIAPPRRPDVVQAFSDPVSPAEDLRQICQQYGIEFVSYSTLGTQHQSVPHNPVLSSETVLSLADKYQRSTAEVVLSWALQRGMSVIPRSGTQKHIEELARLLDGEATTFVDPDDLRMIDALKGTV